MNDPDNSDTDGDDGDNDELSFGLPCCSLLFKLYITFTAPLKPRQHGALQILYCIVLYCTFMHLFMFILLIVNDVSCTPLHCTTSLLEL